MDNNTAERAVRPMAVRRKSSLFRRSELGGKSAAIAPSRDRQDDHDKSRSEPPQFFQSVFCSKLKLLHQRCSCLHRMSPLLLVA
ncbi:MAG: transposase [Paracoccaceae bacterium]